MLGGHTRGWIMGVPLMPKGVLGKGDHLPSLPMGAPLPYVRE